VTTDLKQERLCKKTTLWAECGQNVRKKRSSPFGQRQKKFFFSRKYRSLQYNKHFVKKQRRAKQKDGQSQRWGKVKKNSKSLLTLGEVGKM
jgi:hypothetical protein